MKEGRRVYREGRNSVLALIGSKREEQTMQTHQTEQTALAASDGRQELWRTWRGTSSPMHAEDIELDITTMKYRIVH